MGQQSFDKLVEEGLLVKDYFILTNTRRPIECYAKTLPTNQPERDIISNKLRHYNIQLSDYIDVSRSVGIQSSSKLSLIGKQLFSKLPYATIYDTSGSSSSVTDISLTESSSSNNSLLTPTQPTFESISINRMNEFISSSHSLTQSNHNLRRNVIVRRSQNINNSLEQYSDIADDNEIISTNELLLSSM